MIMNESFHCGPMYYRLKEFQKRLQINELARVYHWNHHILLAPLNIKKLFFFLNDTAPPDLYSLPLHAALPIFCPARLCRATSAGALPARAHFTQFTIRSEVGYGSQPPLPGGFSTTQRASSAQCHMVRELGEKIGRAHV